MYHNVPDEWLNQNPKNMVLPQKVNFYTNFQGAAPLIWSFHMGANFIN